MLVPSVKSKMQISYCPTLFSLFDFVFSISFSWFRFLDFLDFVFSISFSRSYSLDCVLSIPFSRFRFLDSDLFSVLSFFSLSFPLPLTYDDDDYPPPTP